MELVRISPNLCSSPDIGTRGRLDEYDLGTLNEIDSELASRTGIRYAKKRIPILWKQAFISFTTIVKRKGAWESPKGRATIGKFVAPK